MHSGRTQASADPEPVAPSAARANKLDLIERLADDLAHEIKNPLHSMVINLEVLKRRIASPGGTPSEELLRYVGVLGSELDRVSRRIELLLRLVRPDRGGSDPTTLEEILGELLELLSLERERRRISIRYEPADIPVRGYLPLDPSRQLVLHLLVEAVELVPPGGELRVETEVDPPWARLRIDGTSPEAETVAGAASVRDELRSRLAVAHELAHELGGRLEIDPVGPAGGSDQPERVVSLMLSLPMSAS